MNFMLWGVLCLALSLNLEGPAGQVIDCAPDFVGYLLLAYGAKEVNHWSKHFRKIEKTGILFAIYSAITWARDAFNIFPGQNITMNFIVDLLEVAVCMVVLMWIFKGIHAVELQTDFELRSVVMKVVWIAMLVFHLANFVAYFFPPVLQEICGVAAMVAGIGYTVAFFLCKCHYEDAMAELEEEK